MPQLDVAIDRVQVAGVPTVAQRSVHVTAAGGSESGEPCGEAPGREP